MENNYKVDLSDFSKDVTEIFNGPYTDNTKYDMICMLLCSRLQASVVSILIYGSKEDKLICSGNYFNTNKVSLNTNDSKTKNSCKKY
ncbi:hypothetical protein DR864_28465 (plasmid) [Runella rosea]|uniref:Uncharacterized protein n=1 Tax=Runella rosea TaxID=2259595 RepID=A0A344TT38_9BACT|nr:hypothetical protein DR864_28465 [Runella rosea]